MNNPRTSRGLLASVAGSALAGIASAALLAAAMSRPEIFFVFLVYVTALPLFVTGLGAGSIAALIASVTGTAGLFFGGPSNVAVIYAFVFAVPVIILTTLALRYKVAADENGKVTWYPAGNLLTIMTFYPCAIFLALTALLSDYKGGLLALTQDKLQEATAQMIAQLPKSSDPAVIHAFLDRAAQIVPAIAGTTWVIVFMACMGAAQVILQNQKWNLRESFALKSLQVPNWLIFAVAAAGLAGAFAPAPVDYMGTNLSLMLGLPFFFVGLAVMHGWIGTTRWPLPLLILFYVLVIFQAWLVLVVALIGIVDQWADFRRRLSIPKTSP